MIRNLLANEKQLISVAGKRFSYVNGNYLIRVKTIGAGADARVFELYPGMGFELKLGKYFTSLEIENTKTVATAIEYGIDDEDVFDNRTVGNVSVVSADKQRTIDEQAYGRSRSFTSSASNYPVIALENPAGSGKKVFLNKMLAASGLDSLIFCGVIKSGLAALHADASVSGLITAPVGQATKRANSVVSSVCNVVCWNSNVAALPFVALTPPTGGMLSKANVVVPFDFREPYLLEEDSGFYLMGTTTAMLLQSSYEWFEEPK